MGEWTRRAVLVFLLPVAIVVLDGFFLWEWSPSWLDPRIDYALMLIDSAGFRWLNETWLKVDRGVSFYNNAAIPLDAGFLISRLVFIGLGLLAVEFSRRHFTARLRGTSHDGPDAARLARPSPIHCRPSSSRPSHWDHSVWRPLARACFQRAGTSPESS